MALLTRSLVRPVVATSRVVKRRDFERLVFADATVTNAKADADRIRTEAVASARALENEALQRGLSEGQGEIANRLALLTAKQRELLESMVPTMAKLMAEALVQIAGEIDKPRWIARSIDHLRQQLHGITWIRLQVAPQNADAAREALLQSDLVNATGLHADVVESASVGVDDFVVETDLGFATARLSEQVNILHQLCVAALQHGVRSTLIGTDQLSVEGQRSQARSTTEAVR
jgi:flagellar biosynthesis/type III secretory pathway protein FliH